MRSSSSRQGVAQRAGDGRLDLDSELLRETEAVDAAVVAAGNGSVDAIILVLDPSDIRLSTPRRSAMISLALSRATARPSLPRVRGCPAMCVMRIVAESGKRSVRS